MNDNEFDLTARAWLGDGPSRISDRALSSALEEIHTTRQRRALRPAWRATRVSTFARVGIAAVLVVSVGLLAINVLPRQPDQPSIGGPSASPSPSQAVDFPDLTRTFVSPRNGFSIKHPDTARVTPAKQLWGFARQKDDDVDLVETGLNAVLRGASLVAVDPDVGFVAGSDVDGWIDEMVADLPGVCHVPRSQQPEISIDGQPGRVSECPNGIDATVLGGRRLYVFTLVHDRSDARAVFDAFAATIDLTPETAIDYPALTSTFVSPTYGYSFGYMRRLEPATERWDPINQPLEDRDFDHRFDAVETGLAAYFEGASTEIPDGVSIDDWVDQYVTPIPAGGCGVPRSQQAEITIDGQPGRIVACANGIQATVGAGGRVYLFILSAARSDARAFFDSWIATIDLRPEDAAVPSTSPSP
ncbi:MAG: hypothetical protein ACJ77F_07385 [Chloroflexota bacterium]